MKKSRLCRPQNIFVLNAFISWTSLQSLSLQTSWTFSAPNATYKVKQLIKKGFLSKERSEKDKREFILVPTQKFFDLYENKEESVLINDLKSTLDKKELKKVDKIVRSLNSEKN